MSLDVYLTTETKKILPPTVPIRRNGRTELVTVEEYNTIYPGRVPIVLEERETDHVFSRNITHNLGKMADMAGIYEVCWRPDEHGYTHANMLIEPLEKGLKHLKSDPEYFKTFNAPNGWGVYENLVEFVEEYLAACEKWPQAQVGVSR